MGDKRRPKSDLCPWLPHPDEADALFVRGVPGETSDYWTAPPTLPDCPHGNENREWLPDGRHYQEQMRCHYHGFFINPNGFTCRQCIEKQVPAIERWRHHLLPQTDDKNAQAEALVDAVEKGRLAEADALTLGKEFGLTDEAIPLESRQ